MPLTDQDYQRAFNEARNQWLQTHSMAYSQHYMENDPVFQMLYNSMVELMEEEQRIQEERIRSTSTSTDLSTTSTSSRSDSAITECPLRSEQHRTRDCNFLILTLNKRGDTNRIYQSSEESAHSLSVVAGRTDGLAEMECRVSSLSINCPTHNHRMWNISPVISSTNLTENGILNIQASHRITNRSIILNHINPTRYRIVASTCNTTKEVELLVYPDKAVAGRVGFNFSRNSSTREWEGRIESMALEMTENGRTHTLNLETLRQFINAVCLFLNFTNRTRNIVQQVMGDAVPFEWELTPPGNVQFELNAGWRENSNNLNCGYYIHAQLGLNPLIGIEFTANLGEIAIRAILMAAPPLQTAYSLINRGLHLTEIIQISFSIQSELNVNCTLRYNSTEVSLGFEGGTEGVITLRFSITINPERFTRQFGINCNISAGLEGAVNAELRGPQVDRQGGYVSFASNFNGLRIYAGFDVSLGTASTRPQRTPPSRSRSRSDARHARTVRRDQERQVQRVRDRRMVREAEDGDDDNHEGEISYQLIEPSVLIQERKLRL